MSLVQLAGGFDHLLQQYGYVAVIVLVFLESTGVPSPGETMLITAAAYAGATHALSPPLVILSAAAGGILGDNLGYWVGREGGWRLLRRYGRLLHVNDAMLKVGIYLFRRHGGKVVFIGRFTPLLRTWGAILAGVNRFPWPRFLAWNTLSGIAWASSWGLLAFAFGKTLQGVQQYVSLVAIGIATLITLAVGIAVRRNGRALSEAAERALPGSLDEIARRRAA